DRKLHLWMEPDHDLVETDLLDRLLDVNLAALELDTGEPVDALDHVGDGHRAVELAFVTGVRRDDDTGPGELLGDALSCLAGLLLGLDASLTDLLGRLHGAGVGLDGVPAGQQVVAGVSLGDVYDVALLAQRLDVLGQYELHRPLMSGRRAISRAFLIAVATLRWHLGQRPVTRRPRILPRSDRYLRRDEVSFQSMEPSAHIWHGRFFAPRRKS